MAADLPVPFTVTAIPGAGAFAVLCLATDVNGREVALKVLKPALVQNAEAVTRLRDEARVLLRLDHPNVVGAHDLVVRAGRPVLLMEAVQGVALDRVIRSHRDGLSPEAAAELVLQTCRGLHAMYTSMNPDDGRELQVVHRDIKPENLMLTAEGVVKIVDFGTATARLIGLEARDLGATTGTRGYMAPERLAGQPDSPAGDVYALGITLFQLLTGKQMVVSMAEGRHDDTVFRLLDRVTSDTLNEEQLRVLRHLVRRMCLFEAELRPSPETVVTDIERMLDGTEGSLAAFAAEWVPEQLVANSSNDPEPRQHAEWSSLAFVEEADEWHSWRVPQRAPELCDAAVTHFLSAPDWHTKLEELQLLLVDNSRWTEGPFTAVVRSSMVSKWQFWVSRPSDEQVATALEFLRQRPTVAVRELVAPLATHDEPRIRAAVAAISDAAR